MATACYLWSMRSDLFFKVEVEHEKGDDLPALGEAIARWIQKVYSVRQAQLSSITSPDD